MGQLVDLKDKLVGNYKEKDVGNIYKFAVSYAESNQESLDVLSNHGVNLSKPSQTIVLTIEPKELERQLKLAEEMGFIGAYQQNPRFITQPVEMVIKRMAKCDSIGVTYKNEEGIYASFIFSQRAFDYIVNENDVEKKDELVDTNEINMDEVKENALRLLESFAMTDEKDNIFAKLDSIKDTGLSEKEMLVEVFKGFGGNEEFLINQIDEVLASANEMKRGRAA